jgi:2-phospho-L-lactate guanylyltransferase (CobY/MobA/RfbA family)
MDISLIIPVYREKTTINELIDNIKALKGYSGETIEIIVSDCEPGAATFGEIREPDVLCICSRKGRAAQMNKGALLSRGKALFFLHADTCPPKDALNLIRDTCFRSGYKAGAFSLSIESAHVFLKLVSLFTNLRCFVNRKNAFLEQFSDGCKRLLLIGSDIPSITTCILEKGFESLDTSGCVIVPALDGGFYLIGFRQDTFPGDIFDDISWSTRRVLQQTENKLANQECTFEKLTRLRDMDRFDDICDYYARNGNSGGRKNRTIKFSENNLLEYFDAKDLRTHT